MPLNVRRFCTSFLLAFSSFVLTQAQTAPAPTPQPVAAPPVQVPTSGDVMRERISKAKAYIAVRNYNAAIFELENIRKETSDAAVKAVVNVLLMNSYLEQSDYKHAQELLNEFYAAQKTTKPGAAQSYMAVAGQIIKGARSRAERYKALGLSVSDRTLPLEATNDLEKMRETLELVITQSKEIGANKEKAADAMMLLEEASSSRSMLARDDYDQRRWRDEVADTREKVASSQSTVVSAVNEPAPAEPTAAPVNGTPTNGPAAHVSLPANDTRQAGTPVTMPVADKTVPSAIPSPTRDREVKIADANPSETAAAQNNKPIIVPSAPATAKEESKGTDAPKSEPAKDTGPIDVGSELISYATTQAKPIYPATARTMRATGVVRVEVTVNEAGEVATVQKMSGHSMLQSAARDAIMKWKFRPFTRDGQPVKATGFVNFNFAL